MTAPRRFWLFVTRQKTYSNDDGTDREDLAPGSGGDDGWWTCHKDTRAGDLALLYRTNPRSDIAYLFEIARDARLLEDKKPKDRVAVKEFWAAVERFSEDDPGLKARLDASLEEETRLEEVEDRLAGAEESGEDVSQEWDRYNCEMDEWGTSYDAICTEVFSRAGWPPDTDLWVESDWNGSWTCEWTSRYKFEAPLKLKSFRRDPYLADWKALRGNFQRRVFEIPPEIWDRLIEKAAGGDRNPTLGAVLAGLVETPVSKDILTEKEIEERLLVNLAVLKPDYNLKLFQMKDAEDVSSSRDGQQFHCPGLNGFIDILCVDLSNDGYLVIELKRGRAGASTITQIKTYMGWVQEHLADDDQAIRGLVISKDYDEKFKYAVASASDVTHMPLSRIAEGLGLPPV